MPLPHRVATREKAMIRRRSGQAQRGPQYARRMAGAVSTARRTAVLRSHGYPARRTACGAECLCITRAGANIRICRRQCAAGSRGMVVARRCRVA